MTLEEIKSRLEIPLIAAPMFIVSGVDLVIECCKNGVLGTFPSLNGRTVDDFEQMLIKITTSLKDFEEETGKKPAPFGVNIIVNKTNPRVQTDLALCVKYKVPLVITSLGAVEELVNAVHSYGGVVFHDVIKKRHAEKAAQAGVDGIIAVSAGAGGHGGTASPFALIKEIRSFYKGAVILSGAMSTGGDILAAQCMGADFAYMGTRFIATSESQAAPEYKEMLLNAAIEDVTYTDAVSGVYGNFLSESIQRAGIDLSIKKEEDFSKLSGNESKAWKDIWSAGHGAVNIRNILPASQLISQLKAEYSKTKDKF